MTVLVKGSRVKRLERVVERLLRRSPPPATGTEGSEMLLDLFAWLSEYYAGSASSAT